MPDITLRIIINAQNNASGAMQQFSQYMSAVQPAAMAAGAALLAFGAAVGYSVKAAADFQSGLTTLVTGAGESSKAIGMVGQSLLQMSVDTGTSTQQLIQGMFMIESAGYHGAAGLEVMRVAAEGSKVGNADLAVVANALTTVMTDYGIKAKDAATAMNFLTAIVQNGKTTMQDLAGSMSQILPTASAVGVHLIDVGAAMATMTAEGVPAANAATYLRQLLIALSAPAKAGSDALKAIGLTTSQVSAEMKKSLPDALSMIMQHLAQTYKVGSPQYVAALKAIAGGSKQMQGLLDLTGTHLQTFEANMKNVSGVMNANKGSVAGWSAVQQTFNFKMDQARAAVQVAAIEIGTKLLPVLGKILGAVTPLITNFAKWAATLQANSPVLAVLGGVLAGLAVIVLAAVVPSLIAMAGGFLAVTIAGAPLWAIVLAVIAAVALLILAIQHWGQITAWLKGVWSGISSFFGNIFSAIGTFAHNAVTAIGNFFSGLGTRMHAIWSGIQSAASAAWSVIVQIVRVAALILLAVIIGPVGMAVLFIVTHWNQVKSFLAGVWGGIVSLAKSVWGNIVGAIKTAIQTVVGWFSWLYNHNYYFHDLVNGIRTVITGVSTWLQSTWKAIVSWVTTTWQNLKTSAQAIWTALTTAIQAAVQTEWKGIVTIWNAVMTWLTGVWNNLKSLAQSIWTAISGAIMAVLSALWGAISAWWAKQVAGWTTLWGTVKGLVQSAWSAITGVFSAAWAGISGALSSIWHNISSWFSNLASIAITWGKNVISGFISGIMSMVGAVGNAAKNIISTVASFLGFHSPAKMGEGQHIIEWGQNAVKGFVEGMKQAQPQLQAQLNAMIKAPQQAAHTTNITHGPVTLNVSVNMASGSSSEVSQLARNLGDKLRAQFGNI
jgi:TP901 family phage tail tape measure protein